MSGAARPVLLLPSVERELGPIVDLLKQFAVEDVALNPDGKLWVKRTAQPWVEEGFMSGHNASSLIGVVASLTGRVVNEHSPVLETTIAHYGVRFQGLVPPIVTAPSFSIRKTSRQVYSLERYLEDRVVTEEQADVLSCSLVDRLNIIVAGGTGSGKTTLLDTLLDRLCVLCPDDRVVTIEELPELQCQSRNLLPTFVCQGSTALDCLRASLRVRPTRIVVGEVRGEEAFTMLKSMDTGHPGGLATVHANSALNALTRLEILSAEGSDSPRIREIVAAAVKLIVFVAPEYDSALFPAGRRVTQILAVHGIKDGQFMTEPLASSSCRSKARVMVSGQ